MVSIIKDGMRIDSSVSNVKKHFRSWWNILRNKNNFFFFYFETKERDVIKSTMGLLCQLIRHLLAKLL